MIISIGNGNGRMDAASTTEPPTEASTTEASNTIAPTTAETTTVETTTLKVTRRKPSRPTLKRNKVSSLRLTLAQCEGFQFDNAKYGRPTFSAEGKDGIKGFMLPFS